MKPDSVFTIIAALQAYASLVAQREGKGIHNLIVKNWFELVNVCGEFPRVSRYSQASKK